MSDYFQFHGYFSNNYGIFISGEATFVRNPRERTFQSIPGRNGDLILDDGRYPNVIIQYPAFIRTNFPTKFRRFVGILNSFKTYSKLSDTYNPDEFRLAIPVGVMEPKTGPQNDSAKFTIEFNCKPQRFLASGETVRTYTESGLIINPETRESQPLIRVYGAGTVGIESYTMTIANHGQEYMDIDCALMDAHHGAVNLNRYLTLSSDNFPVLKGGDNNITLGSGITKVEITPRWWRL